MPPNILSVKNISKSFVASQTHQERSALQVLNSVSLDLMEGESLALVGRSGSGKSTFLSLCALLDRPDHGDILWEDQLALSWSDDDINRYRSKFMGFIFQQFHLIAHFTAYENCRLPLDLNEDPRAHERTMELMEALEVDNRQNHFPDELSRGEAQRIAIARALALRPRVILADEPTASLDDALSEKVTKLFLTLSKETKTSVLLVTHDAELAQHCDRTLRFHYGQLKGV